MIGIGVWIQVDERILVDYTNYIYTCQREFGHITIHIIQDHHLLNSQDLSLIMQHRLSPTTPSQALEFD